MELIRVIVQIVEKRYTLMINAITQITDYEAISQQVCKEMGIELIKLKPNDPEDTVCYVGGKPCNWEDVQRILREKR